MFAITTERDDVTPYIVEILRRLNDVSQPLRTVGATMQARISNRFETQSDPMGKAWHPWAKDAAKNYPYPGTDTAKRDGVGSGRMLNRYGDMLRSLNYQLRDDSVTIGFGDPKAVYHEYGASSKKLPHRGMMFANPVAGVLSEDDEESILSELYSHFDFDGPLFL